MSTPLKAIAAIAQAPRADFAIREIDIDAPRAGEVQVEIKGVGLCHTDLIFRDQFVPLPLPAVLGQRLLRRDRQQPPLLEVGGDHPPTRLHAGAD